MSADVMRLLADATGLLDEPGKKAAVISKADEPRVLLVTTVDIGGGASERIEVRAGEEAQDVARAFCLRHGLPDAIVVPLSAHLEENLKKAAGARAASGDSSKSLDGRSPSGLAPPQPTASAMPVNGGPPAAPPIVRAPSAGSGTGSIPGSAKPQYSFGQGMDDQAYQQLSSKLMDESAAPPQRRDNWVVAGDVLSGGNGNVLGGGSGLNGSSAASKRSSMSNSGMYMGQGGGKAASAGPSPRDSVHLRLYATAQERQARHVERRRMADAEAVAALAANRSSMSWISAEMMRGRGAGISYDNYGEMLYNEGVEGLMTRLKRGELERKARDDREVEGLTFTPAITRKAWELKQRERSSLASVGGLAMSMDGSMAGDEYEKWQRLHARGMRKSTQERLENLRTQREAAEVSECTFRPRINRNSDALMSERAETLKVLNITHHEQLFADALRRQAKLDDLQRWYPDGVTFQPAVNKDPRAQEYLRRSFERLSKNSTTSTTAVAGAVAASTVSHSAASAVPSVVERLYAEAERKQAKLEATRLVLHGNFDPVTNKPLYQPEICRGPRGVQARAHRPAGVNIGDHLYRAAQELAAKRTAAEDAERRTAAEEAARSHTTNVSRRMFTELKMKRFRQIFEYLDEEGESTLDLLAALGRAPPFMGGVADPSPGAEAAAAAAAAVRGVRADNLDNEVLLDVEAAADVWARANGLLLTHEEQGTVNGSPRGEAGSPAKSQPPALGGSLQRPCPPLSLDMFMSCMEEALRLRRGPRAYLVPSPSAKQAQQHSFRPAINARSRALAAKSRPDAASTFELLHRVAAQNAERLEALRRDKEAAGLEGCTFQPQLNANRNVSSKALRASQSRNGNTGSPDRSGFAAAAASIAAAAEGNPDAAEAASQREELAQRLQHLRLAADHAAEVQEQLMWGQQGQAEPGGEGVGQQAAVEGAAEVGGAPEVDEEVARFALLEQELRDMAALTVVAIDDRDKQLAVLHAARQQAPARQQRPGVPAGGLQHLAAELGVGSWNTTDTGRM